MQSIKGADFVLEAFIIHSSLNISTALQNDCFEEMSFRPLHIDNSSSYNIVKFEAQETLLKNNFGQFFFEQSLFELMTITYSFGILLSALDVFP
jgi:hypothetical protein